jgi:1-acyl-sn-glycerol-3-phosphate acyltransferase
MKLLSPVQRLWYATAKFMVRIALSIAFHARYSGQKNVPLVGGVLVVSNHQSHLDPPLVGAGCPRQMTFLARMTLFRFSPFGKLIRSLGAIPIDREGSALSGIRATLAALRDGQIVLVFPEGTRSRDGDLGSFKGGLTLVARRARVPILPAAVQGAYDAWPRSASFPSLRTVHVHYGRIITPQQIASCSEQELVGLVEERVQECLAEIRSRREFAQRAAPNREMARR